MRDVEQRMKERKWDLDTLTDAMEWTHIETIDRVLSKGNHHLGGAPFKTGHDLRKTPTDRIIKAGCRTVDEYIALCFDIGLDLLRIDAGLGARTGLGD